MATAADIGRLPHVLLARAREEETRLRQCVAPSREQEVPQPGAAGRKPQRYLFQLLGTQPWRCHAPPDPEWWLAQRFPTFAVLRSRLRAEGAHLCAEKMRSGGNEASIYRPNRVRSRMAVTYGSLAHTWSNCSSLPFKR